MYAEHFGLTADPFNLTPDPAFLYLSQEHREALPGDGWWPLQPGHAQGRVVGGNLATLNLLQGTGAVSANIASPDGYTLYVSDRRGDKVKSLVDHGVTVNATNGMVDNEDIYGPNGALDPGANRTGAFTAG